MKKFDYKKHLYKTVIIILVVFFVGGVVIGGASILHMDGAYPPYEPDASVVEPPETPAAAVALLNDALSRAISEKPKIEAFDRCSVAEAPAFSAGGDLFGVIADAAENSIEDAYDEAYNASSSDFGEEADITLKDFAVSPDDVTEIECSYIYYTCANCGENANEYADTCEKCGLEGTLEERLSNTYTVTLRLDAGSASFLDNFAMRDDADMQKLLEDHSDGWYTVSDARILYSEPNITLTVNRLNGDLTGLFLNSKAALTAHLSFGGAYEQYGETDVTGVLDDSIRYEFTWPYVSLPDQEPLRPGKTYTIEPRKTEAVQIRRIPDAPEIKISWKSSDESVVTVDEDGYIKSGKNPGEATLTASFEFGGKTYSDEMTVRVRIPVERLNLNKYSLSLAPGETYTLKTSTTPKKATVQTVKWYAEDERVAAVDENGVVTAVGAGETVIYALSDDGFYKASCKVGVKD